MGRRWLTKKSPSAGSQPAEATGRLATGRRAAPYQFRASVGGLVFLRVAGPCGPGGRVNAAPNQILPNVFRSMIRKRIQT